jgi:hypothetical protein
MGNFQTSLKQEKHLSDARLSNRFFVLRMHLVFVALPIVLCAFFASYHIGATTFYVNINNPSPSPPFMDWSTAATNIQDAVDLAIKGDVVLVTNGIYRTGGFVKNGSNRVAVLKPIQLQSVNGPSVTEIVGERIRCVYMTNGASLVGFTLSHGYATGSGDGGGAWCQSTNCLITNCIITLNYAADAGGGVYQAFLANCLVISNTSGYFGGGASLSVLKTCKVAYNSSQLAGGGISGSFASACAINGNVATSVGGASSQSTLHNCTVVGNTAFQRVGGVYGGIQNNCIIFYNYAPIDQNYSITPIAQLNYCCTTPVPISGIGNFDNDPQLSSKDHISVVSPCRGAVNQFYLQGADCDGEQWGSPPAVGCDEIWPDDTDGPIRTLLHADYKYFSTGMPITFEADVGGSLLFSLWDFGDGSYLTNHFKVSHVWTNPGDYVVRVTGFNSSYPDGISADIPVRVLLQPTHFVSQASISPTPPFTSWETAAIDIQDAVDVAGPGALILVTNGIFSAGSRTLDQGTPSRLLVTNAITVKSVNGPDVTTIQGYQLPGSTNGLGAIRCAYLTTNSILIGFCLTNGATWDNRYSYSPSNTSGGGLWCESTNVRILDCHIFGNSAYYSGGGVFRGTLENCIVSNNFAPLGGGAAKAQIRDSLLCGNSASSGGGAFDSHLDSCAVVNNFMIVQPGYGTGTYNGSAQNCIYFGNVGRSGGCVAFGTLYNCTIVSNTPGTYFANLYNCISYYNSGDNYLGLSGILNYCCTFPSPPSGVGNITNAPGFSHLPKGDLHLLPDSPCINSGKNNLFYGSLDYEKKNRISGGTVDIGAYEFQNPSSSISYAWLQQYGFPIDGSLDNEDSDGDRFTNMQEWRAGTTPTDAASALILLKPEITDLGIAISWQSVTNHNYFVERGRNGSYSEQFETLATNILGNKGITTYTDTNTVNIRAAIYRVGTQ